MSHTQGYDPRTGRPVGPGVADCDDAVIESALAAADAARRGLAESSAARRTGWLTAVGDALGAAADELVASADAETALGVARLTGELARTRWQIELFTRVLADGGYLDVSRDAPGSLPAGQPSVDLRRMLHPVGPVAVWAASNFPFAFGVSGGDTVSALAAGCPVLVKSHPSQPATSALLGRVIAAGLRDGGAPPGAFAVLHGERAGDTLIADRRIRAAAFTGSLRGGRALYDRACARPDPIPFYGELGSLNPVFVSVAAAAARCEAIADGFVAALTLGVGQFCTKPGILVIPRASGLVEAVASRIGAATGGALLNRRIQEAYLSGSARLAELAGPQVRRIPGGTPPGEGYLVSPTALVVTLETLLARFDALAEECFGPFALLVEYSSEEDLPRLAARFPGSLTGTVHAESGADDALAAELIAVLRERVGRIVWNGWPTGVAVGWAMQHGGPYPASTAAASTSVGARAIGRFLQPTAYQDVPAHLLPPQLRTPPQPH
jgi:NADP-dependent aldehyde dehydrogenase